MNHTTLYIYMGLYLLSFIAIVNQQSVIERRLGNFYSDYVFYFVAFVGSFFLMGVLLLAEIAINWVRIIFVRIIVISFARYIMWKIKRKYRL